MNDTHRWTPRGLTLSFFIGVVAGFGPAACGPSIAPVCAGACSCGSNSCQCAAGQACTFGGADGGAGSASLLPSNVTFDCASQNTCTVACAANCTTSCAGGSTCNQQLGAGATITCAGGSTCDTKAGADAGLTCSGGAKCEANLGAHSTVVCQGTSTCKVECPGGGCTVACQGDAVCTCDPKDAAPCTMQCQGSSQPKQCGDKLACVRNGDCP